MAMPDLPALPAHRLEDEAMKAWRALQPEPVEPVRIEILKGRKGTAGGSACRLAGVGAAGTAVIAKRCRRPKALIEHAIYADVLPHLPIPALRCYGCVEETDGQFCWLFLEDAGEEKYSICSGEHRALAGEWLGLLHTSAARAAPAVRLPERGLEHYREQLRSARDRIPGSLANPALSAGDRAVLAAILSQCEVLTSRWNEVEELCEAMPRALVHGDFVEKNLGVRTSEAGIALLPFDWGNAGWGVPAIDLAQSPLTSARFSANPDLDAYWTVVRERWLGLDRPAIQRWANLATMFRCLTAINWSAPALAHPWVEEHMLRMRFYQATLTHAMEAAGWVG